MASSVKTIIKAIGSDHLALYNGNGYWYFIYDDAEGEIYASESVYTMRLSDMDADRWIETGKAFVAKTVADAERKAAEVQLDAMERKAHDLRTTQFRGYLSVAPLLDQPGRKQCQYEKGGHVITMELAVTYLMVYARGSATTIGESR